MKRFRFESGRNEIVKCSYRTKKADTETRRTAFAKRGLPAAAYAVLLVMVLLISAGCGDHDRTGRSKALSDNTAGSETVSKSPSEGKTMSSAERTALANAELASAAQASKGDVIFLGKWEEEPLSWIVLERKEDRLLLITENILKTGSYHETSAWISWETCSLRSWLNNDFYHSGFSRAERSVIAETTIPNDDNPHYKSDGGKDTKDRIFLLSTDEAETYFPTPEERMCSYLGTESWWWLRTPGKFQYNAAAVRNTGVVYYYGEKIHFRFVGIRPALWIDLTMSHRA